MRDFDALNIPTQNQVDILLPQLTLGVGGGGVVYLVLILFFNQGTMSASRNTCEDLRLYLFVCEEGRVEGGWCPA